MNIFSQTDTDLIKRSFRCKCPACGQDNLFGGFWILDIKDKCADCGLDLTKADIGDGAVVFLIFILGTIFTPLALLIDTWVDVPLWAQTIVWGVVIILSTIATLKPLKSYILALQYKHRKSDWDS